MEGSERIISREELKDFYEKSLKELSPGEIVKGKVVSVTDKEAMIDIGYKAEGTVPLSEFDVPPKVGEELEVYIRSLSRGEGPLLSMREAQRIRAWENLVESFHKGEPIKGKIIKRVKGGYKVETAGIEAFLPLSQTDKKPVRHPDEWLDKELSFKVMDLKEDTGNVILSRKRLLEEEEEKEKRAFWNRMKVGKVFEGKVKSLTSYGAFVDLGVVDGLLHINDISWRKIKHPSEVLSKGQRIWVKVLSFDKSKERVSLGMKQLSPDPWDSVYKKYPVGKRIKGRVTGIMDYGAFVELEEGIEGLIHVSEFSWSRRLRHPSEFVKVGDEVECVVISVDKRARRLSLSLRRITPDPWDTVEEKYPVGKAVKGVITRIYPDRALVELEEGVEGVVRCEDLSWNKKNPHPDSFFTRGEKVELKVLDIDKERKKIKLGLKQLKPDPWKEFERLYHVGDDVRGKVTSITDFGVFLEIMEGIEGLIHISQLDERRVKNPHDVVKEGDTLTAKIMKIDPGNRRISLSIKEYKRAKEKEETSRFMNAQMRGESILKLGEILGKMINKKE